MVSGPAVQAAVVGAAVDSNEGPPMVQSQMTQLNEFLAQEVIKTGPITWTVTRCLVCASTVVGITIAILHFAGVISLGDGASDGTGTGSAGSFVAGTRVKMADGMWQCVEEIRIGDHVAVGGRVTARMEFEANLVDLYHYPAEPSKNPAHEHEAASSLVVAGRHAVWEATYWQRVRVSTKAQRIDSDTFKALLRKGDGAVRVFDVDVEKHRLLVRPAIDAERCQPESLGDVNGVVFADFIEVDVAHPVNEQCDVKLLQALDPWLPEIDL